MWTDDTEIAYIGGPSDAGIITYWMGSAEYDTERRGKTNTHI